MLLSLNWLREFVPYTGTAVELGRALTMLGLELDALSHPFKELDDLVVGYVEECAQHPDADRLSVCKVNAGTEILDIVCGAPNVRKGQFVVVAPVGAALPGGLNIKKTKLRGQPSHGMICSERELNLSDDHSGIMVLQDLVAGPLTPGQKALEAMKLDTEILDINVTPNRADCLSVLGLAREVSAAFELPLSLPELDYNGIDTSGNIAAELSIELKDPQLAPTYYLKGIENVRVTRSPAWLRWRLLACGLRSISNVVDVTNYILLELGQPMHSFDLCKIRGKQIKVAPANDGEIFTTLDGNPKTLTSRDLTIRDQEGAIALAGVMGGQNSEITAKSTSVLLESAVFNPSCIRRTSKRLEIPSESSYRFERGVDQAMSTYALERAAIMICRFTGGKTTKSVLGDTLLPWKAPQITLRHQRAETLIGVPLGGDFCEMTLRSLGCELLLNGDTGSSGHSWTVTPPSHRLDLEREADLIEELARVYGVDRIPERIPAVNRQMERAGLAESKHKFFARIKNWACGLGLNEAINYSFVGNRELDLLGLPDQGRLHIMNPLSADLDVLRTVLAPGLLNTLRHNIAQGASGLRIFEIANAFSAAPSNATGAHENARLGLMFYGDRYGSAWPRKIEDAGYLDLKGFIEHFIAWLDLPEAAYRLSATPLPWISPTVDVTVNGEYAGSLGRVKPEIAHSCHARKEIWMAELDLDALYEQHRSVRLRFKSLPVYPPVRRDITVIAPLDRQSEEILRAIYDCKPAHLESAYLADLFQKDGSKERNLTFRLVFRHSGRTLLDADVDKVRDKVATSLVQSLGVKI